MTATITGARASTAPSARVVSIYCGEWSVFSSGDRYHERRHYWSRDEAKARKFARAFNAWVRGGLEKAARPLSINDAGAVYRQCDFDALSPSRGMAEEDAAGGAA